MEIYGNIRCREFNTLLQLAAISNHKMAILIAQRLVDLGVDLNAATIGKQTALDFALTHGHNAVAELLIKKGAKRYVDCRKAYDWCPLQ